MARHRWAFLCGWLLLAARPAFFAASTPRLLSPAGFETDTQASHVEDFLHREFPERTSPVVFVAFQSTREPLTAPAYQHSWRPGRRGRRLPRLPARAAERLPLVFGTVVGCTLVLPGLCYRSVVLPVKAVLMNLLSVGGAMGALVWGFQDGHFSRLLDFEPMGFIEATIPPVIFAALVGVSRTQPEPRAPAAGPRESPLPFQGDAAAWPPREP